MSAMWSVPQLISLGCFSPLLQVATSEEDRLVQKRGQHSLYVITQYHVTNSSLVCIIVYRIDKIAYCADKFYIMVVL